MLVALSLSLEEVFFDVFCPLLSSSSSSSTIIGILFLLASLLGMYYNKNGNLLLCTFLFSFSLAIFNSLTTFNSFCAALLPGSILSTVVRSSMATENSLHSYRHEKQKNNTNSMMTIICYKPSWPVHDETMLSHYPVKT